MIRLGWILTCVLSIAAVAFGKTCACGDMDQSGGVVNLVDYVTFATCFNQPATGVCECADLDGDNSIDLQDFTIFGRLFNTLPAGTSDCANDTGPGVCDYWVSPTGNGDGSYPNPWGITQAESGPSGGVVCFTPGVYNAVLNPAVSGVTWRAAPGAFCQGGSGSVEREDKVACAVELLKIVADESGTYWGFNITDNNTGYGNGVDVSAPNVVVENNKIHDRADDTNANDGVFITKGGAPNVIVRNNEITYCTIGINVKSAQNLNHTDYLFTENTIYDLFLDGIKGVGTRTVISYNWLPGVLPVPGHRDGMDIRYLVDGVVEYNDVSNWTQLIYFTPGDDPSHMLRNTIVRGNVLSLTCYPKPNCGSEADDTVGIFLGNAPGQGDLDCVDVVDNVCGDLDQGPGGGDCIRINAPATNIYLNGNDLGPGQIELNGTPIEIIEEACNDN